MIAVDAGPFVALLNSRDRAAAFAEIRGPLITTWPALTEAFHLVARFGGTDALWELVHAAEITVVAQDLGDQRRMRELMQKYADLPMDLADASIVVIAEKLRIRRIFTVDQRDFRLYRPRHLRTFDLIPRSGA